ncbi:MAG: DUF1127 domain-containing protein [Alphaproteobacteria bacterium]|jgi:uncharacterized protein YjiS (DUF1127 family)|uniref:DUF1127 domain-containing protein n=1 Tax=Pacificispira sp. TaxID=2888761 RepID=UPI001B0A1192|nr:DUF1127 domain-containing protein [Alphaproteobacteria bacterium]MBO6863060.1 DUF1127 domain-containing protein [Alphaproteobacteria bacterium]
MAVTTLDAARSAQPIKVGSFAVPAVFSGIVNRIAAYMERRKAVAQLQSLTDRELADIGLTRTEIENAVAGR